MAEVPTSGISEKVEILKETAFDDGGAGGATEFGYITKLGYTTDAHVKANYSTDGQAYPNTLVDGVLDFTGSLNWDLTDGRELTGILGTLTDAGSGSFSIATANTLPSYSFKAIVSSDQNVHGKGMKFSNMKLNASRDSKITMSGDFVARQVIELATSVTPQTPTEKPFVDLDLSVTIDGGTAVDLEDISLSIDRGSIGRRGIEDTTAGERRLISSIISTKGIVTGSATAIGKKEIFESVLGGSTLTDYRSNANVVVTIGNGTNTLVFTIPARLSTTGKDIGAEDDLLVVTFDFIGTTPTVSGTYTV